MNIQIVSITVTENNVNKGAIDGADLSFTFNPIKDKNNAWTHIDISWNLHLNCKDNCHINHTTKTVFSIKGIPYNSNLFDNDFMMLFAQLVQTSLSHARVHFVNKNGDIIEGIPAMIWFHELFESIKDQIIKHSN